MFKNIAAWLGARLLRDGSPEAGWCEWHNSCDCRPGKKEQKCEDCFWFKRIDSGYGRDTCSLFEGR